MVLAFQHYNLFTHIIVGLPRPTRARSTTRNHCACLLSLLQGHATYWLTSTWWHVSYQLNPSTTRGRFTNCKTLLAKNVRCQSWPLTQFRWEQKMTPHSLTSLPLPKSQSVPNWEWFSPYSSTQCGAVRSRSHLVSASIGYLRWSSNPNSDISPHCVQLQYYPFNL